MWNGIEKFSRVGKRLGVCIIVAYSSLLSGCITPVRVEGIAMNPNFHDGDRLFMVADSDIERFDVIYFRYPKDESKTYIKRVIGLPGETVAIRLGKVIINDRAIEETFLDPELNQVEVTMPKVEIPANEYFVLGDNRDNSSDSRYWGTVNHRLVLGRYSYRYFSAK